MENKVTYHRNGITGIGFYTVKLFDVGRKLIGILFDGNKHFAVIDPLDSTECYRGDHFNEEMLEAIKKFIKNDYKN